MSVFIEIVVFLVVLVVLVLVHEFGHFLVAKIARMRVDEFGIGFPPRALTIVKFGGTEYTLNWLPFGGFVSIFGEDGSQNPDGQPEPGSFVSKPRIVQALVLLAGVAMNIVFAYVLLTATLALGTQQELSGTQINTVKDAKIVFAAVKPGSPADKAGFMVGDEILSATTTTNSFAVNYDGHDPAALAYLISTDASGMPMSFLVDRNGKDIHITATPKEGVVPNIPTRPGLGVTITSIGTVKTPILEAPVQGLSYTWNVTEQVAVALYDFLKGVVMLKPNLSQVSGPVGIATAVGQATATGVSALLTLVALISINLAIVNLIPVPALDGGRLLFVIIEAIIRKPIDPKIANRVNAVGFALLILLMVVVTAHDILNLIT